MGKYKKRLREEKAKVKLKDRRLPKGLNETKTEFKVRKIVIKEQLKEIVFEEGKKKQNLKELLSKLKHHNDSFRKAALRSIVEFLDSQRDEIQSNLGPLIQGIASMCLDIDKHIRRESFKILTTLLAMVPSTTVVPFFPVISSYLCCSMTHIQQPIQEDSLLMLDVLLFHIPNVISADSNKIFTNFLDMISKFRTDAKPGRTLTTNLTSCSKTATTAVRWRSKILERLKEMLVKLLEFKMTELEMRKSSEEAAIKCQYFDSTKPMYFPIVRWELNRSMTFVPGARGAAKESESNRLKTYIGQLIPLLLESWMEARNYHESQARRGRQSVLTNDAAQALKTVLEILINLWELAAAIDKEEGHDDVGEWFKENCRKEFNEHIMNGFPYQQAEGSGVSKSKSKSHATDREVAESGGQYCFHQNLNLIYLFCVLNIPGEVAYEEQTYVLRFLIDNIQTFKELPAEWISPLPKCLEQILFKSAYHFLKLDESKIRLLLRTVLKCFQTDLFGRENKNPIFVMLCDIVLDNDLYKAYGPMEFDEWLRDLPQVLCKSQIQCNIIRTLTKLGKQKSEIFLEALRDAATKIIENLSTTKFIGCDDQFENRRSVMNLFYWIDTWKPEDQTALLEHVKLHITDETSADYFLYILSESFEKQPIQIN